MPKYNNNVYFAFEILMEEIELVIDEIKDEINKANKKSNFDKIPELSKRAQSIEDFREKIKSLQKEWNSLYSSYPRKKGKKGKINKKLKKGLRTPEDAFRKPILEALVELGGSARMQEVLEVVEKKMKDVLNEYDLQPLPSSGTPRWKNTAQWCRNTMVNEGLLKSDSPHGVWEISEEGKGYLKDL